MDPFKTGSHGAAVAFVSAGDTAVEGAIVGRCSSFVSPVSGILSLGVNDKDPGNNKDELHFVVRRRLPSTGALPGTIPECPTEPQSS